MTANLREKLWNFPW